MSRATIEGWSIVPGYGDAYTAPELRGASIHGRVYGREPEFDDGALITTSRVVSVIYDSADGELSVVTKTGTHYILGAVDRGYDDAFPGARERLIYQAGGDVEGMEG